MLKNYILQGLDCANCASKIEKEVENLNGVLKANINFAMSTLTIDIEEKNEKNIKQLIEKIVHRHEPDIVVLEKGAKPLSKQKQNLIVPLNTLGILLFAAGFIIPYFYEINETIIFSVFILSYIIFGGKVILQAIKNIVKGQIFDENFLMSIATIGAFLIGEYAEAAAVMIFYNVGEYFQDLAVNRSKKSIAGLMDIRQDFANLSENNEIRTVSPESVATGNFIIIRPGEKIPLDGIITEGVSELDTTALTGEAVPKAVGPSDTVLSGCINLNGLLTVKVTKTYSESTVSKILELVENAASKKAPSEKFITTFSRYYTPVVVVLAALICILPPLFLNGSWSEWLNRGLIFLVISCPCALVASIPLSFFGGIGSASRKGILIKGGNYLEALSNVEIIAFDKTGTLTEGVFGLTEINPMPGFSNDSLLELAAAAESFSNHPIAKAIVTAYSVETDKNLITGYKERPGYGVSVTYDNKNILAGNLKFLRSEGVSLNESDLPEQNGTLIYISSNKAYAGYITVADKIKPDAKKAIQELKSRGVRKTVMLTGDNEPTAKAVANALGIDEVHFGLLPEQKVDLVERLSTEKNIKGKLAFIGDGINDAPVLARADIGIAMGGLGSDAAVEAADVVLMTDEPAKLAVAIDISHATKQIVRQNIIFVLLIKCLFLTLGAFGVATMWEAVFADVGTAVLAVLNASRIMRK